ncbi:putative chitinase 2-like protein [Lasius niger]|uniref:Putative chitinase 2-like protein n=1 Tax=Lasius niger TaxID=67767 RepID=A0A0J7KST7_LASNI|nr:putative chitinase 2-like protein [Lasius niger]
MYVVGESLEANCTSSAAHPVPYITWFINGKEVDITLVNHYPHTHHKNSLMSATARLKVEVSALHAGENGLLEISCRATIPAFPMQHEQFADIRKKAVSGLIKPKHDKVVVCYVASWAAYRPGNGAFSLENLRPGHCTHLIYAFAGINASNWTIKSLDPWADMEKNGIGNYRKMTALRKQGLKVSLGIGGWNEGSINYSMMASSSDRRKTFIASTVEFLRTYEFDGLDLDWEFPGSRGGALYDKQNFVSLVKELRDTFRGHRFLLTAAISANKDTIDMGYDIPKISKYLDYIHVMAYDYHGAWNKQVLPNSPLRSKDRLSVEDTITYLLQQGAPAEKLVLGLAMYGRTFVLTTVPETPKINPIGLPSLDTGFKGPYTSEDGFMGFNEICEALVLYPQEWTTGWDNYSSTAYAIKKDHVVVYDDRKAIMIKVSLSLFLLNITSY